ncbi:hypothetical protein ACJMK2_031984 [Sinanodonta woodiana]|uniref:Mitochondria-eating protein n=1 Tax=Sinanodonta woodiana TaxID=1069815 RepID=A0ABD3X3U5_SINWO
MPLPPPLLDSTLTVHLRYQISKRKAMGCGTSFLGPSKPPTASEKDVETISEKRKIDNKDNGRITVPPDECSGLQREGSSDSGISISSNDKSSQEITKTATEYNMIIADLKAEVQNLREEKDALLTRLSAVGAVWLTDNNPRITDLSDENRPGKLLEQFSQIYDNEWTDGFEYLTGVEECREQTSIQQLLLILKDIYNECLKSTRKQRKKLQRAVCAYLGVSGEFQKDEELILKETEKKLHAYRATRPEECFARITKVIGENLLKKEYDNKVYVALNKYIQGCIRVCWFMCVRNPPMHLYFGQNLRKDGRRYFDDTKFVSYTRSGKYVKFIVWPAVFLHEDGPMLKKGVAQGGVKAKTRKRKSRNRVDKMTVDDPNKSITKSTIKET